MGTHGITGSELRFEVEIHSLVNSEWLRGHPKFWYFSSVKGEQQYHVPHRDEGQELR